MKPLALLSPVPLVVWLIACSPVKTTSKLATKTVTFVGKTTAKTTVAAVKAGGSVAATATKTTIQTTGYVVSTVAKAGFVTVKDVATGVSKEIPYSEGLKLYAATQTAKVDAYLKAFEILRDGVVIRSDWRRIKTTAGNPALKPGDVIQVKQMASAARSQKRS